MDKKEFAHFRNKLKKTQQKMAELLGKSLKAVHSYEQGWRKIPADVERQVLFLISRTQGTSDELVPCWDKKKCPLERKSKCPAWEFQAGQWCWFINGTICQGKAHDNWEEKMKVCRECKVLKGLFNPDGEPAESSLRQ